MRRAGIVFLGGGIGSCLRAALLAWLAPAGAVAPVLLANLVGAFVLGLVWVLADEAGLLQARARFFLAVGMLGGFTTFSTFGWGVDALLAGRTWALAAVYLAASIGGGIVAVVAGLAAGRGLVALAERTARTVLRRLDERGPRPSGDTRTDLGAVEAEDREESA